MQFGKSLSHHVVPEWKAQYLDYNSGKSLMDEPLTSKKNTKLAKVDRSTFSQSLTHLELPSPALVIHERPATRANQQQRPITERSPLIEQETSETSTRARTIDVDEKERVNLFFTWLDQQVDKIDKFYAGQEHDAVQKFHSIETQMKHLQEHQEYYKDRVQRHHAIPERAMSFFDHLELPRLPKCFTRSQHIHGDACPPSHHEGDNARQDFARTPFTYSQSKHMLKVAMVDYYHFLQQLRQYQTLNETGIRKIVKKFDKKFDSKTLDKYMKRLGGKNFVSSQKIEDLAVRLENLYAETFEGGNHKASVQKLQSRPPGLTYNLDVLVSGMAIGGGLPLFVLAMARGIARLHGDREFEARSLLQIWAGFLFLTMALLLFSLNLLVFHIYRINYKFIFEFVRNSSLDYRQYPVMPSLLFFALSLFGWLTFDSDGFKLPGRYFPCIFLGVVMTVFLLPVSAFFWKARKWMMVTLMRLFLSGLYSVEFRDFFVGDVFCSLSYSLSNAEFFYCIYSVSDWWTDPPSAAHCTSSRSHWLGFLSCLPGIWRFLQCIRRYADTFNWFPHLLNAGKYSCLIVSYMLLSLARIHGTSEKYKILYLVFAVINTIYSSMWDIFMDFSLGPNLRAVLIYPRWTYYCIMVVDPLMRLSWILYAVYWNEKDQSAKISVIVALIELLRRFLWVFFRVENEHASNVEMYRAFKDPNFPYISSDSDAPSDGPIRMQSLPADSPSTVGSPLPPPSGVASSIIKSPTVDGVRKLLHRAHTVDFERRTMPSTSDDEDDDDDY